MLWSPYFHANTGTGAVIPGLSTLISNLAQSGGCDVSKYGGACA